MVQMDDLRCQACDQQDDNRPERVWQDRRVRARRDRISYPDDFLHACRCQRHRGFQSKAGVTPKVTIARLPVSTMLARTSEVGEPAPKPEANLVANA